MKETVTDQNGFTRILTLVVMAGAVAAVGTIVIVNLGAHPGGGNRVNTTSSQSVPKSKTPQPATLSFQGSIELSGAGACAEGATCSNFYLHTSTGIDYSLLLSSTSGTPASNEQAVITGTVSSLDPHTIKVTRITPVATSP
jgi:hypothetical protein